MYIGIYFYNKYGKILTIVESRGRWIGIYLYFYSSVSLKIFIIKILRENKWGSLYTALVHCCHVGIRPTLTRYSEFSKEAGNLRFLYKMLFPRKKILATTSKSKSTTTTKPLCRPDTMYLDAEALGSNQHLWFRSFAP